MTEYIRLGDHKKVGVSIGRNIRRGDCEGQRSLLGCAE